MSAYDNALDSVLGYFCVQVDRAEGDAARAELAALLKELKQLSDNNEQARWTVSEALFVLDNLGMSASKASAKAAGKCRAWLAANAPANAPANAQKEDQS